VFAAIEACHQAVHAMGCPRVYTTVKINSRTDKDQSLEEAGGLLAFGPSLHPPVSMDRRQSAVLHLRLPPLLRSIALGGSALLLASPATAAPASYEIQASTSSGMGAAASGMEMMRMLMGGGKPTASRSLDLTLRSSQSAPSAPQAEHLIPAGLGLGNALPLLSPASGEVSRDTSSDMPKGRLVIFRGCAGTAAADRPEMIDFTTLLPEQRRKAEALASRKSWSNPKVSGVSSPTTMGTWPNRQSNKPVPANASLTGDHRVQSNYAPEIRFQVGSNHDFMAPVQLTTRLIGEAIDLSWSPVPTALGSQAMAFGGGRESGDVVLWTSSSAPWSESGVPADLDSATARNLIGKGVLIPPEQTRCTIGAAAMKQLGEGVVHFTAYGDTLRVVDPASSPGRPPVWSVTLMRASTSTLPLMEIGDAQGEAQGEPSKEEPPQRRGGWGLIPGLF
jgi:hypothetical protein